MNIYLCVVNQTSWDSFPEPRAICPAQIPTPKGAPGSMVSRDDSCLGDLLSQLPPSQAPRRKERDSSGVQRGLATMQMKSLVECVDWQVKKRQNGLGLEV